MLTQPWLRIVQMLCMIHFHKSFLFSSSPDGILGLLTVFWQSECLFAVPCQMSFSICNIWGHIVVRVSCCMLFMFILCRICHNEAAFIVPRVSSRLRDDSSLLPATPAPLPSYPPGHCCPRPLTSPPSLPVPSRMLDPGNLMDTGHGSITLFFFNFPTWLDGLWMISIKEFGKTSIWIPNAKGRLFQQTSLIKWSAFHHYEIMIEVWKRWTNDQARVCFRTEIGHCRRNRQM